MEIKVIRKWFTTKSTVGQIFVNGEFECYSMEDVARAEDVKIYGETCIPKGKYSVGITYSNRYKKDLPLIYNTDDFKVEGKTSNVSFAGIRIHPGNTDADTHGCILPGSTRSANFVGESKKAFTPLLQKIKEAIACGEGVDLEITHEQLS